MEQVTTPPTVTPVAVYNDANKIDGFYVSITSVVGENVDDLEVVELNLSLRDAHQFALDMADALVTIGKAIENDVTPSP